MTILETNYSCNMCGKEMKHKTPKLVMGEFDGENFVKLDVHICESCRPELVAYANGKKTASNQYGHKDPKTGMWISRRGSKK